MGCSLSCCFKRTAGTEMTTRTQTPRQQFTPPSSVCHHDMAACDTHAVPTELPPTDEDPEPSPKDLFVNLYMSDDETSPTVTVDCQRVDISVDKQFSGHIYLNYDDLGPVRRNSF